MSLGLGLRLPGPGYFFEVNAPAKLPDAKGDILGIPLVWREDWGLIVPELSDEYKMTHPVNNIVHTYLTGPDKCSTPDSCKKTMQAMEKEHIDHGMPDIACNFLVGADGRLYEGRGWDYIPQRFKKFPDIDWYRCLNICFVGSLKNKSPSEAHWKPAFQLMRYAIKHKYLEYGYDLFEIRHKELFD